MDELISKSQKKRDAEDLKQLGQKLIALKLEDLNSLPLTETLHKAIQDAKYIKSHGAIRRQYQLIGKLMRSADYQAITEAFSALQAEDSAQTAEFHVTEIWRDKLMQEGSVALSAFIDTFHPEDIQYLRQLIKKAVTAQTETQQKTARKALFRFIRQYV